jgi:hypothetical protein
MEHVIFRLTALQFQPEIPQEYFITQDAFNNLSQLQQRTSPFVL